MKSMIFILSVTAILALGISSSAKPKDAIGKSNIYGYSRSRVTCLAV